MKGTPVEPPFGCKPRMTTEEAVLASDFERCLSGLTYETGMLERIERLTPEQLVRIRQAVIRLSNYERKQSRE